MKKMKIAAAVMAAAVGCSGTVLPCAVSASPTEDNVLMVCDFENGAELPVTSSGGASAEVTESPIGTSYKKIGSNTLNSEENVTAGLADYAELCEADKDNHVLKLTGAAAGDSNTVTVYEGILPEDFALDFSALGYPNFAAFTISIEQDGSSYNIIRYDQWNSVYLTGSKTRYASASGNVWCPVTMILRDFASDNTKLMMYMNGRLNYTANAANPQGLENAYPEVGGYYSGLDLTKNVKIMLTQTGANGCTNEYVCFDNFRIYKYENNISNEAGNDFETEKAGMAPMQNDIRTGGQINRQWFHSSAEETVQQNYGLAAYETTVEEDPLDPSNKVIRSIRGDGSNEYGYDGAVRFTVNKPKETLEISFKALTSSTSSQYQYNIAVDIADGTFGDVFFQTESKTPADRIFTLNNNADAQFVSSGRYRGYASDLNWELDKWNDVKLVYSVEEDKTSFEINGVTFDITPNTGSIISDIMSSDDDTVTVGFLRPFASQYGYIMLDDISIKSDGGNTDEPEPGVTVTERMEAVNAEDKSHAGYFWNVTVPTLESKDSIKGTFTSEKEQKTMEREFDITMINGGGGAVFSVLLLDAPDDVTAKFE